MNWSEAQKSQLRDLWAKDLSAKQIATEMNCGISKNAVIGMSHRMELPMRRIKSGKPVDKSKEPPKRKIKKVNPNWVERTTIAPAHLPALEGPIGGVSLRDLAKGRCHAITGVLALPDGSSEPAYCGATSVPGKAWCAHHFARYTQPPRGR